MTNPNRIKKGVPTGGRFAERTTPEPSLALKKSHPWVSTEPPAIAGLSPSEKGEHPEREAEERRRQRVNEVRSSNIPEFLSEALNDSDPKVRLAAAGNRHTPRRDLREMARTGTRTFRDYRPGGRWEGTYKEQLQVMDRIAGNPNTGSFTLGWMSTRHRSLGADRAAQHLENRASNQGRAGRMATRFAGWIGSKQP